MSDQNEQLAANEVDQKVAISPEDCNAALDFWRHFNIPIPADLQGAMDGFAKDPTWQNQEVVKLAICKAISETDHQAFKDEMFSKIVEETAAVSFDLQFDQDLEKTLDVNNK